MTGREWLPGDLLQLSGGYWATCALHAAVRLDLFTPITDTWRPVEELAAACSCDARALAMLLNAMAALELVLKDGDRYRATNSAARYLAKSSPDYVGQIIMHHHHLAANWVELHQAVRTGRPLRLRVSHGDDAEARESFEMGMFNLAMLIAPKIVAALDLTGRRRLLDLGGGPGTYAIHFCGAHDGMNAVVYDLPTTRPFAEATIARFGLSNRIAFHAGDFDHDPLPGRFDVIWISHVLHSEGPAGCARLLKQAVQALEPGGLLLVQEFILDDSKQGPLFPALFSLNMLLGTGEGQAYSRGELQGMMAAAGLDDVRSIAVDLPNGAGVLAGTLR